MKTKHFQFYLFSIILSIAVSSCGNDDDKNPSASLVGSWKEVSLEYFDCPNASENNLDECGPTNTCETWQFNADGTHKRTTHNGIIVNGTYYVSGAGKINLCYPTCGEYTYTLSGATLTITEITAGNECVTRYKVSKI